METFTRGRKGTFENVYNKKRRRRKKQRTDGGTRRVVVQDGRIDDLLGELSVSSDGVVDGGAGRVGVQDGRIDDLLSNILDGIDDAVVLLGGLGFFSRHVFVLIGRRVIRASMHQCG